jgi:hypothetical protein
LTHRIDGKSPAGELTQRPPPANHELLTCVSGQQQLDCEAHPLAQAPDVDCDGKPDPWFSNPFDVFWFNPSPDWGIVGPEQNATLDLDDTDGAGPENVNHCDPEGTVEDPYSYSVGVHYYDDHGFGQAFATVRVFLSGLQVYEGAKVKLDPCDLWYVGKISWPNQITGGNKSAFTACNQEAGAVCWANPANKPGACGAGCGKTWKVKGDRCITKGYVSPAFQAASGASGACAVKP